MMAGFVYGKEPFMFYRTPLDIRVSIDVGCKSHQVAVGLSTGEFLEEFSITHQPEGFRLFFTKLEKLEQQYQCPVRVAMEGYNGYARPLDSMVLARGWQLNNINNLKLARFKEIFPGAAKSDVIDARRGLELFQLMDHLPTAKKVLQVVAEPPRENQILKRLSRRRRRLVNERVRILNNLQADLQAVCPSLLALTGDAGNYWFLQLLTHSDDLRKLVRLHLKSLRKIPGIGAAYASRVQQWQKQAQFSAETEWVGEMIQQDAARILELHNQIKTLEAKMAAAAAQSKLAGLLATIPGFGPICTAEVVGEIGHEGRFAKESSLALYLGMAILDNSSGQYQGTKIPRQINSRAKAAMMTAVDRHRKQIPASQRFYEKKRAEGKGHNQAIRALGRHLCRIIFRMFKEQRPYMPPN
jgi:transposase